MLMDIDYNKGYGYSVWFVPKNYKELQEQYNIHHIPHITLETNLRLRDAFHIYHNACKEMVMRFKQAPVVKFPSLYNTNDPMVYYGWNVEIIQMTRRKLNWTPHMTLAYLPRQGDLRAGEARLLSNTELPPLGPVECFITIADTRSGVPEEWHMNHTYFNIKASQSYMLSFDTKQRPSRTTAATGIDEYFGTSLEELESLPEQILDRMRRHGIMMNDNEIRVIVGEIRNELVKAKNIDHGDSMDIDKPRRRS